MERKYSGNLVDSIHKSFLAVIKEHYISYDAECYLFNLITINEIRKMGENIKRNCHKKTGIAWKKLPGNYVRVGRYKRTVIESIAVKTRL